MPGANPKTVLGILKDDRLDPETKKLWLGNYSRETGYDNPQAMMEEMAGGKVDVGRSVFQGPTAKWGDEFLAAMRSGLGRGDLSLPGYDENLAKERAVTGMYELENPGKALAGELAGAGAMMLPPLGVAGGVGRAAITGAIEGGLTGAGAAEGDAVSRLEGGAFGAPFGAILGPVGYGAGKAAEAGVRGGIQVSKTAGKTGFKIAKWLANFLGYGRQPNAERQAMEYFAETLSRHGLSIEEGIKVLEDAAEKGIDMRAADLTPEIVSYMTTLPGRGQVMLKDMLEERARKMGPELEKKIMNAFGGDENALRLLGDVRAQQTRRAAEEYPEAYAQVLPVDDQLLSLLQRPSMSRAWRAAVAHAEERGLDIPQVFKLEGEGEAVKLVLQAQPGPDSATAEIPMEAWDWMKRGLDRVIRSERNDITDRLSPTGGDVQATKTQLLGILDVRNPAYGTARQSFADSEEIQEALRRGVKFLREDPDQLELDLEDFTDAQRQFFRVGVSKGLIDLIRGGSTTANKANKIINSRKHQLLMQRAFNDDARYVKFKELLELEAKVSATRNELYNSKTASRLAGHEDIPMPTPKNLQEDVMADMRRDIRRRMSDEIARIVGANPVQMRQIYKNPDAALADSIQNVAAFPVLAQQGAQIGGYVGGAEEEPIRGLLGGR